MLISITTVHYNKAPITKLSPQPPKNLVNVTLPQSERQKRLLPYINFYMAQSPNDHAYVNQNQPYPLPYHHQEKEEQSSTRYTPFLESNALPGPFLPMVRQKLVAQPQKLIPVDYDGAEQIQKVPNYSALYDKLSQLKLQQQQLIIQVMTEFGTVTVARKKVGMSDFLPRNAKLDR